MNVDRYVFFFEIFNCIYLFFSYKCVRKMDIIILLVYKVIKVRGILKIEFYSCKGFQRLYDYFEEVNYYKNFIVVVILFFGLF